MPATFEFEEDNGAATGSPAQGTTRTGGRTEVNWKNVDDSVTTYSSAPITAGNNSFSKYQFGHFSGTFTTIMSGLWAHTSGAFGTGITLKGTVTNTYATPGTAANAAFTTDMTTPIAIASGAAVLFGPTGPQVSGMGASSTSNPTYSQYLGTQLQTTTSAAAGDTATATFTLQYQEN